MTRIDLARASDITGNSLSRTHVYLDTDQLSAGSGTVTTVSFTDEDVDDDGCWAIGTPTDLIIPAGLNGRVVRAYGQLHFYNSTSGVYRDARITYHPNGGSEATIARVMFPDADLSQAIMVQLETKLVPVSTGDAFRLKFRVDSTTVGATGSATGLATYFGLYTVD